MNLNLFGSKKEPKPHRQLVVDIRSSSVSAAIVNTATEIPEIEFVARNYLYSLSPSAENINKFLSDMVTLVDKTLDEIATVGLPKLSENKKNIKIEETLVTYGSPWHKVFTKDIKIKKEEEFILTREKFSELVKSQIKDEEEKAVGQRVVEKDVTNVILNGYELTDPFNKKTKELTLSFYVSLMNEKILSSIEEKIDKHFHKTKITNRTFPIILFNSIRNNFINANTFTFFDISGEVTDFGVVDNGALIFTGSVPTGKNHIVRSVAESCKMENTAASSIIGILAKGETHESCAENVSVALEKIEKDWVNSIKKVVEESNLIIPKKVFITVDEEGAEIFSNTLNGTFSKRNLFDTDQDIQAVVLGKDKFRKLITTKEGVKTNPHLILASLFLTNS